MLPNSTVWVYDRMIIILPVGIVETVDLICPSSKISKRFNGSLKVHKEGGEERFPSVQRLQGLGGEKEDESVGVWWKSLIEIKPDTPPRCIQTKHI